MSEVSTQISWYLVAKCCEFQVWPSQTHLFQQPANGYHGGFPHGSTSTELPHLPCRPGPFCALDQCQKSSSAAWRKGNPISEFLRFAFCCDWRNSTDWGEAFIQSLGDVWSLVKLEHCLREVKVHEFHLSCASPGSVG